MATPACNGDTSRWSWDSDNAPLSCGYSDFRFQPEGTFRWGSDTEFCVHWYGHQNAQAWAPAHCYLRTAQYRTACEVPAAIDSCRPAVPLPLHRVPFGVNGVRTGHPSHIDHAPPPSAPRTFTQADWQPGQRASEANEWTDDYGGYYGAATGNCRLLEAEPERCCPDSSGGQVPPCPTTGTCPDPQTGICSSPPPPAPCTNPPCDPIIIEDPPEPPINCTQPCLNAGQDVLAVLNHCDEQYNRGHADELVQQCCYDYCSTCDEGGCDDIIVDDPPRWDGLCAAISAAAALAAALAAGGTVAKCASFGAIAK